MDAGFERVYTVTDYHDGPRAGVADFEGAPHRYASQWDDTADDVGSTFVLTPISAAVLALELESWAIWLRWQTAFHAGRTTLETHPALPEERARREELAELLARPGASIAVHARAEFRPAQDPARQGNGHASVEVRWTRA